MPNAFDDVIARCLSKDPAARYATADVLADELYPLARRKVVSATPGPPASGNGLRDRAARLLLRA